METFKQRMARIRKRAGYRSQGAASEAIGCERGTVSMWEAPSSNVQQVSADLLFRTARAYRVRPEWINNLRSKDDGFPEPPSQDEDLPAVPAPATPDGYVRFQLLEGVGGMGDGAVNQDYPEVIRQMDVAEWEVRRKLGFVPTQGRIRMMTGRGPSMHSMIEDGEVVWVDTAMTHFDGDAVYVINLGGETQIKMLQMRGDGLYVVSANANFPAYKVDSDAGLHIGGKVVAVTGTRAA